MKYTYSNNELQNTVSQSVDSCVTNLEVLLNSGKKYRIPVYQRPYEWRVDEIERLLDQIKTNEKLNRDTILGTLQLNSNGDEFDIIDGQQRVTTLYLLFRVLEIKTSFHINYDNEDSNTIKNGIESYDFVQPSVFTTNYEFIRKKVEKNDITEEYLKSRVLFVVVETTYNELSELEELFDVLNTAGRPLEMKDLFKLKFSDVLGKSKEAYTGINNSYMLIDSCGLPNGVNRLVENDLLDAFKFFLVVFLEIDKITANVMKRSINDTMDSLKKDENIINYRSSLLEAFCGLAEVMKETQDYLNQKEQNEYRYYAKDLLAWSGYNNLRNIFYALIYVIKSKEWGNLEYAIEQSLRITELLWKYCSLYHCVVGQIINPVYEFVGTEVLRLVYEADSCDVETEILKRMRENIKNSTYDLQSKFEEIIYGDVFNNTRRNLFLVLSYIDDSKKMNERLNICKEKVFYLEKWTLDIEHIISDKFCNSDLVIVKNGIGNLMFLERKINRAIGSRTGDYKNFKSDFFDNKMCSDKHKNSYSKSGLSSVITLRGRVEKSKDIIGLIQTRQKEKESIIFSLYSELFIYDCENLEQI